MPLPESRRERLIRSIMKHKKADLVKLHRRKHPADPALYRRSKREIAIAFARPQWWPQQDFPASFDA